MNLMEYLNARANNGIALLEEFHHVLQQTTTEQFAVDFGYRVAEVKKLRRAWELFKHPTIRQSARLSLSILLDLTSIVYPLRHRQDRVEKVVEICQLVAGKDPDTARQLAQHQVSVWTEHTSCHAKDTARCHRTIGRDGKRRLVAAYTEHKAAHINAILDSCARELIKQDKKLRYDHAFAEALYNKITATELGHAPKFGPMFMIATDLRFHSDGQIATTDGAVVDLKTVVDTELSDTGYAAVIAKNVDTNHREIATFVQVKRTWPNDPTARFAGEELRLKAVMDTLVCTWPGCRIPAISCQAHHIQSFHRGGPTTGENITPLCPHHNGINDDNPNRPPKNGRIERHPSSGRAGLRRKPGAAFEYNQHPATEKSARSYIQYAYRS